MKNELSRSLFSPRRPKGWSQSPLLNSDRLTDANWTIFYLWSNDTDPTFVKTNQVLATYRLQLQLRSQSSAGPPPYANCP